MTIKLITHLKNDQSTNNDGEVKLFLCHSHTLTLVSLVISTKTTFVFKLQTNMAAVSVRVTTYEIRSLVRWS